MTNKIIDLWNDGYSMNSIVKMVGRPKDAVRKILNENGIVTDVIRVKKFEPEHVRDIVNDYNAGMSMAKLGTKYRHNLKTLVRILADEGIEYTNVSGYDKVNWDDLQIVSLLKKHGSIQKVHKLTGISWVYINRYVTENNIQYDHVFTFYEEFTKELKDQIVQDYIGIGLKREEVLEKYGIHRDRLKQILKEYNNAKKPNSPIPEDQRNNFIEYNKKVRNLSSYLRNMNGLKNVKGKHWNHRLSVVDGFLQGVAVEVVASIVNLELIDAKENIKLSHRSKITKEQLLEEYLAYIRG